MMAEKALGRALTTRSFGTTFDLSSAATECTAACAGGGGEWLSALIISTLPEAIAQIAG